MDTIIKSIIYKESIKELDYLKSVVDRYPSGGSATGKALYQIIYDAMFHPIYSEYDKWCIELIEQSITNNGNGLTIKDLNDRRRFYIAIPLEKEQVVYNG